MFGWLDVSIDKSQVLLKDFCRMTELLIFFMVDDCMNMTMIFERFSMDIRSIGVMDD